MSLNSHNRHTLGEVVSKPAECPSPTHDRLRNEWATYRTAHAEWAEKVRDGDATTPEPEEPRRWVPAANPYICGSCATWLRRQLGELTELAPKYLTDNDGYPRDTREGERVAGSADPASPSRPSDDVDELVQWLSDWEAALRGQPPLVARCELATILDLTVAQILARFDTLLLRDDVVGFAFGDHAVAWWHRYLTNRTRAGRRTLLQAVRCDRCGERNLWWREGDENAECRGFAGTCQRIIPKATIDGWVDAAYASELAAT